MGQASGRSRASVARDASNTARIRNKLDSIIIPRIEFRDASIREAIDFLRQQAAANDPDNGRTSRSRYCSALTFLWPLERARSGNGHDHG